MLVGDAERFICVLEQPRTKVTARGSESGSGAMKPANHSVRPPVPTCRRADVPTCGAVTASPHSAVRGSVRGGRTAPPWAGVCSLHSGRLCVRRLRSLLSYSCADPNPASPGFWVCTGPGVGLV